MSRSSDGPTKRAWLELFDNFALVYQEKIAGASIGDNNNAVKIYRVGKGKGSIVRMDIKDPTDA